MSAHLAVVIDAAAARQASQLAADLAAWRARVAAPPSGAPVPKDRLLEHTSQVERLTLSVTALLAAVDAAPGDPLERARQRREGVHAVHLVWDFFRSKLAQRDAEDLAAALALADDLAYACYRPARDAAVAAGTVRPEAVREPPLVYFAERTSPFVWPRRYAMAVSPHLAERYQDLFAAALTGLPVPVVGVPWGHSRHLPALAAVAHEVGHCVEEDFGLRPFLVARLRAVGIAHQDAWIAWCPELFADLWGLLGAGRAYAAMLAAALAKPVAAVRSETRAPPDWTDYPTDALRIAAVRALGAAVGVDVTDIADAWTTLYGADHDLRAWEEDLDSLVAAWIGAPCPAFRQPIEQVLAPPRPEIALADALGAGVPLSPQDADARRLVVACGEALWTSPATYPADEPALLRRFAELRKRGVRAGRDPEALTHAVDHDPEVARDLAKRFLNALEDG